MYNLYMYRPVLAVSSARGFLFNTAVLNSTNCRIGTYDTDTVPNRLFQIICQVPGECKEVFLENFTRFAPDIDAEDYICITKK
jgi:hypothetical protein